MSVHHQNNSTSLKGRVIRIYDQSMIKRTQSITVTAYSTAPTSVFAITKCSAICLHSSATVDAQPTIATPLTMLPVMLPLTSLLPCTAYDGAAYNGAVYDGAA